MGVAGRWRWGAGLVLAVYLVLAAWWSVAVPLGEGPDEPAHWDYALFLARAGRLPQQDGPAADVPGEGHQPPLAYIFLQPAVRWLPAAELTLAMTHNPQFVWAGGAEPQGFWHGTRELAPYHGQVAAWHVARLIAVAWGAVTVLLTGALAGRLWPREPLLGLSAMALIGWNPQFIFAHALVSNDPALIALSSAVIYGSVRAAQGVAGLRRAALVGGLLGLALLAKQSAVALVPLPALAWWLGRELGRRWARDVAACYGAALLIGGWWFARNLAVYGDVFGLQAFTSTFASGDFDARRWQAWQAGLTSLWRSSWGLFGWQTVALPTGVYALLAALAGLALIGLVSDGAVRWAGRGRAAAVLGAAAALMIVWTVAFALTAGMVGWQGRLVFPAVSALGIGLAAGLTGALPRRVGLGLACAALLGISVAAPGGLIGPTYPVYAERAPAAAGNMYAAFDLGWKRGVELTDAPFPLLATAGMTATVQLRWHAVQPLDQPWTVFVHLVGADETIVAYANAAPLAGRYPFSVWTAGDWVADRIELPLAGVAPGNYELRVRTL